MIERKIHKNKNHDNHHNYYQPSLREFQVLSQGLYKPYLIKPYIKPSEMDLLSSCNTCETTAWIYFNLSKITVHVAEWDSTACALASSYCSYPQNQHSRSAVKVQRSHLSGSCAHQVSNRMGRGGWACRVSSGPKNGLQEGFTHPHPL